MRRGLDWYKREPRAFLDGVRSAQMTDREVGVYSVILDLIYDGGGTTPNDPKFIAAHFSNMGSAAVRKVISRLIELGKVEGIDGELTNKRAQNEAKTRQKLSETRRKTGRLGGVSSGVSRSKPKENKDLDEPNALIYREREENTCTNVHGAEAPPDPSKIIWDSGIKILMAAGKSRNQAGGIVGKWRKSHSDADLISALGACQREGAVDPVAYVTGALKSRRPAAARAEIW